MKTSIVLLAILLGLGTAGSAQTSPLQTHRLQNEQYVWIGQLVAVDYRARVATINAGIPPHVERYVDRFKPGDRVVLVWNMVGQSEADSVLALWPFEGDKRPGGNTGYMLPVEFVSADVSAHTLTFKAALTSAALKTSTSVIPGQWIKARTPLVQSSSGPPIISLESATAPRGHRGTAVPAKLPEAAKQ